MMEEEQQDNQESRCVLCGRPSGVLVEVNGHLQTSCCGQTVSSCCDGLEW